MKRYINPSNIVQDELVLRPLMAQSALQAQTAELFEAIKASGDQAVKDYTLRFDGVAIDSLAAVPNTTNIAKGTKLAINSAMSAITTFHKAQVFVEPKVETYTGVVCWREARPIRRVGLYVPGGTAPLVSTALMLGIPAQVAGCSEIVLCTPPNQDGAIGPEISYIANALGITEIYRIGGAQAIAAMSVGTESITPVDKLFGPGNQYVTAAKQYAYQTGTGIDMLAGPSEVMVIADTSANPRYVAADLLSQAEHGKDSQVVLLAIDSKFATAVLAEVEIQLKSLPRKLIAKQALENSFCITFESISQCVDFANRYAPEHLIINTKGAEQVAQTVTAAGSVFIGQYSPESAGDYVSGTNHTLPTNGSASNTSGLSVADFQTIIQFQELSSQGLKTIAQSITTLAAIEGLQAHANAVTIRSNDIT